jgi:hypothetical protein
MKKRKGLVREPVDTEPTKDIRTRSSRFNCSSHYAISFWREMYAGDFFSYEEDIWPMKQW